MTNQPETAINIVPLTPNGAEDNYASEAIPLEGYHEIENLTPEFAEEIVDNMFKLAKDGETPVALAGGRVYLRKGYLQTDALGEDPSAYACVSDDIVLQMTVRVPAWKVEELQLRAEVERKRKQEEARNERIQAVDAEIAELEARMEELKKVKRSI